MKTYKISVTMVVVSGAENTYEMAQLVQEILYSPDGDLKECYVVADEVPEDYVVPWQLRREGKSKSS